MTQSPYPSSKECQFLPGPLVHHLFPLVRTPFYLNELLSRVYAGCLLGLSHFDWGTQKKSKKRIYFHCLILQSRSPSEPQDRAK